jgi:hypothetical protein
VVDPHLVGEKHIMDSPPADNIIDTTQCIHVHHEIHRALRGSARHRDSLRIVVPFSERNFNMLQTHVYNHQSHGSKENLSGAVRRHKTTLHLLVVGRSL